MGTLWGGSAGLTGIGVLVPGTTPISGGTSTRVLFDDGGYVGESSLFTFNKSTGALSVTGTIAASSTVQSTAGNIAGAGIVINRSGTTYVALLDNGDGVLRLYNAAATNFGGLQFGGTTNSFPGLYRDGAGLKVQGAAGGATAWIKVLPVAVASLPAASTAGAGAKSFVSDANATTFASIVAAGGSNNVPVYSDGTNWRIG